MQTNRVPRQNNNGASSNKEMYPQKLGTKEVGSVSSIRKAFAERSIRCLWRSSRSAPYSTGTVHCSNFRSFRFDFCVQYSTAPNQEPRYDWSNSQRAAHHEKVLLKLKLRFRQKYKENCWAKSLAFAGHQFASKNDRVTILTNKRS